jgi:NAD-dependent dihydropyrimidine dehydrogenase PreA subunit
MVYLRNVVSLQLDETACTGCRRCIEVCPHAVFVMESGRSQLRNRDACMECGACSRNCPAGAIRVQTGVGCANGILKGLLSRKAASCRESRQEWGRANVPQADSHASRETDDCCEGCRHE